MTEKSTEPVRAIKKACALLDLLTEAKRPLSLGELTASTGWAKSTVYGLLSSMRSCNLVEQDAQSGRYTLGVRLFEYGSAVQSTRSIITLSREPMERLVKATGESASLSMLDRYIRTGEIDDPETKALIDRKHKMNLFKLELMQTFQYDPNAEE